METQAANVQKLVMTIYDDPAARHDAFSHLLAMNNAAGTAALLRLVEDFRVPPYYTQLLHTLGQRGALDPIPHFQQILQTQSDEANIINHQFSVIATLAEYPDHAETIPLLAYTLHQKRNVLFLRNCVYTLGRIGNDEAVYILSQLMLAHSEAEVRHDAIMLLGSTENANAVNVLITYLERDRCNYPDDKPMHYRQNAMNSLWRLWIDAVRPFDKARWMALLKYWLYAEDKDTPSALYTLENLKSPETQTIIEEWTYYRQASQLEPNIFY